MTMRLAIEEKSWTRPLPEDIEGATFLYRCSATGFLEIDDGEVAYFKYGIGRTYKKLVVAGIAVGSPYKVADDLRKFIDVNPITDPAIRKRIIEALDAKEELKESSYRLDVDFWPISES